MFSFIKKLFGFGPTVVVEAPYKVEVAPVMVNDATEVAAVPAEVATEVVAVEGAGLVAIPAKAKKPRAKKPAAIKATKKPKA